MKIDIRHPEMGDAAIIAALSKELGYPYATEEMTAELIGEISRDNRSIIFVAVHENVVIGWVQAILTTRLESGTFAKITGLIVTEKCRSQSVGSQLVKFVENWSVKQNVHTLKVRCNVKRADAHRFYLQQEFKEEKEQKTFSKGLCNAEKP
jgi:GNAT superfamily N-acetyltransferase